jgi:ABC-type uncharacterized transport system involved in gliding motility auxiliary subunit
MVFVDPMSRIDMAMSRQMGMMQGQMPNVSSDLAKLFAAWEIEYSPSTMVGDLRRATRINAGGEPVSYPAFISLAEEGISRKQVVTSELRNIMIAEGGALKLKDGSKSQWEALLETSPDAGMIEAMMAMYMGPADLARNVKVENKPLALAGILKGKLKSAFSAPPAGTEVKEDFLAEASGEATVVIFGDVDFMHDSNSVQRMNFGGMAMAQPLNSNLALVANTVEYLGGSEDLISIRSRGRVSRPFTRLEEIQKDAQLKWKQEEERLSQEIESLSRKLNELQAQRGGGDRLALNLEQQGEIQRFRQQEQDARSRRREVRRNLREDIESMGRVLIALNMLVVPLTVAGFGIGVFSGRVRRMRKGREDARNE